MSHPDPVRPISSLRFLVGLAVFSSYHLSVDACLTGASLFKPARMAPLRDWHRRYYRDLLCSLLAKEGILIGQ